MKSTLSSHVVESAENNSRSDPSISNFNRSIRLLRNDQSSWLGPESRLEECHVGQLRAISLKHFKVLSLGLRHNASSSVSAEKKCNVAIPMFAPAPTMTWGGWSYGHLNSSSRKTSSKHNESLVAPRRMIYRPMHGRYIFTSPSLPSLQASLKAHLPKT